MTRHILTGIRPQPLGSYLAGLGLVRLIGEQADPDVTAAWSPQGLLVDCTVDDLPAWLAERYAPTPVLSPWNEGSGFGVKDKTPRQRLEALLGLPSNRADGFREAMPAARMVATRSRAEAWDKERTVREFRNRCPEALVAWIDATVVLGEQRRDDGRYLAVPVFPPLLGTGGNDGRLDFSTNFHQQLITVLDPAPKAATRSLQLARDLLEGRESEKLAAAAVGQFDPGAAGGAGSSPFGAADSLVNPWAYVLMVEGSLLFAASAVRRNQHAQRRAAVPFTVQGSAEGSASGAAAEESRGEVWTPVWGQPLAMAEIRHLFAEARASWRGRPAQKAVEFYAATRSLGVARGVDEFVRYALHRRNGLAFVAVPVERVRVRDDLAGDVRLAADLEDWAEQVRRHVAGTALAGALRRFDAAQMAYVRDGGALALARLLAALTGLELAVGRSGRARQDIRVRRPQRASDVVRLLARADSPELRVAVGLASCATLGTSESARAMRHLLLPINPNGKWRDSPVVPGFGLRPLTGVLADVLVWRSHTAPDEPGPARFQGIPTFRAGIPVPAADLHAFATGGLDPGTLDLWVRACLALDWQQGGPTWPTPPPGSHPPGSPLVPLLGLLHPLALGMTPPHAPADARRLALGPDWPTRLAAGHITGVHRDAVRRLRQAGWDAVPPIAAVATDATTPGTAVAAALVPRCRSNSAHAVLEGHFARRLRTADTITDPTDRSPASVAEPEEELG
jgi:CRISPR-associated protein Csx17